MDREILRAKFRGSMIGTGVGDGLGAGWEGYRMVDQEEVRTLGEKCPSLIYTDDTHMMIGVAESLIEKPDFDGEHMASRFIENYDREPFRGYGPGPPVIFRLIRSGEAWDKAAGQLYGGGSYGNGSAMRIAPVGLLYYDNTATLKEIARKSSHITHAHELGKEGAVLQACAVALALVAQPSLTFRVHEFLSGLNVFAECEIYRQKLGKIENLLVEKDRLKVVAGLGHGIEAFNSVPTAVYSFLRYPHSFEEAVTYAISLGGDTDTIGAMTGAISGAYLGVEAIPEKWRSKLENSEYIDELAKKLWQMKTGA